MPYVPSKKTDGESTDREVLDRAVETAARLIATNTPNNLSVLHAYRNAFVKVGHELAYLLHDKQHGMSGGDPQEMVELARAIYETGEKYGYEGAYLGELNYAITRLIQRVPQLKVESGEYGSELRYWLYAATVNALIFAAARFTNSLIGLGGVFEDIKDEYKRRVNTAYEAAQIVKSGDCYDTPYYTRLVEVRDVDGEHVGYQEIMLQRSDETVDEDVLPNAVTLVRVFR